MLGAWLCFLRGGWWHPDSGYACSGHVPNLPFVWRCATEQIPREIANALRPSRTTCELLRFWHSHLNIGAGRGRIYCRDDKLNVGRNSGHCCLPTTMMAILRPKRFC